MHDNPTEPPSLNSLLSDSPSALAVADSMSSGPKMQETIQSSFAFHLIKARIYLPQGSYAEGITTHASTKLYCLIDKDRVMFLSCMRNLYEMGIYLFFVTPGDKGAF